MGCCQSSASQLEISAYVTGLNKEMLSIVVMNRE
jgi:hypothetical protein